MKMKMISGIKLEAAKVGGIKSTPNENKKGQWNKIRTCRDWWDKIQSQQGKAASGIKPGSDEVGGMKLDPNEI